MQKTTAEAEIAQTPLEALVACHECDLLMHKPHLAEGLRAECPRCGHVLFHHRSRVLSRSLALVITALLLYVPANFLPIIARTKAVPQLLTQTRDLLEILDDRQPARSTLVTSQLPVSQWHSLLGDATVADAWHRRSDFRVEPAV